MGATRAEGGHPVDGEDAAAEGGLLGLEEGQAGLDAIGCEEAPDAGSDDPGDHGRGQLPGGGEQPFAVVYGGTAVRAQGGEQRPFPLLVELADNAGAHVLAPVVELFLELILEELAFLLDHQDLVQPFGEVAHPFRLQGPHHAHLVEADADLGGECFVNAQVVEGLAHVQVALAAGDDAQARLGRVDDYAVEAVGPQRRPRHHRLHLRQEALPAGLLFLLVEGQRGEGCLLHGGGAVYGFGILQALNRSEVP